MAQQNLLDNNFRPDYTPYVGTVQMSAPGTTSGTTGTGTQSGGGVPLGGWLKKLFGGSYAGRAGTLGRILGAAGGNITNQRNTQNNQAVVAHNNYQQEQRLRAQLANTDAFNRAGLDMERKQFQQDEPLTQARQAAIGNLLQRIQPLQMSGLSPRVQQSMPKMNSILDALGPEARQAGGVLAQRGLSGIQNPTQFDPVAPLNLPPATMMALQKSGLLEKILGGVGLAGSVMGGLGGFGSSTINGGQIDTTPPEENW